MHKSAVIYRSQKRASNHSELEPQAILSSLRWVGAGHELRFFARAVLALNHGAIAPGPK